MTDRQARYIAIAIVAGTAILVAALALWRMLRVREPHTEVDRELYPIVGIDLSAHNGVVDFDSVAASGIDFAYLKASEGASFRDRTFLLNYTKARRAGLAVGAYHFFRFDRDAESQAYNFLGAIDSLRLDLPLALDVEEWGNAAAQTTDIVRERIRTMTAILNARGYDVIVYTNKQGYARFIHADDVAVHPDIWICSFTDPPLAHRPWRLWQHSHIASVPGVHGDVDLNTFNGDRNQWQQWLDSCRRPTQ